MRADRHRALDTFTFYERVLRHGRPRSSNFERIFYRRSQVPTGRDIRRSKRKPFEHVALLDFHDGEQPRPCQVRDISAGGARLVVFVATQTIPEIFNLLLSPSAKVQRKCKVAWRSSTELGVQFLKPTE